MANARTKVEGWCSVLILIITTSNLISVASAACAFPESIQQNRYLSTKREVKDIPNMVGFALQFIDYKYNVSKTQLLLQPGLPETTIATNQCEDGYFDGQSFYYRRATGDLACSVLTPTTSGAAIHYKDIDTQVEWSAEQCKVELDKVPEETSSWYIKYPYLNPIRCPLPDGEYPLTYSLDGSVQCEGDANSVAIVEGEYITFNSCYDGQGGYETPMDNKLGCGEFLETGEENGDILLLGDYSDFPDNVDYHCARFKEENGQYFLSVDLQDSMQTRCIGTQDYTSYDPVQFVALVIGTAQEAPTTEMSGCNPDTNDGCDTAAGLECRTISTGDNMCLEGCDPNPCENGGICTETDTGFECECVGDWQLPTCSEGCDPECPTGEQCVETSAGVYQCQAGCDPNPCQNGGACEETATGFECQCPDGWEGDTCTEGCDPACGDGAKCVNMECVCDPDCDEGEECTEVNGALICKRGCDDPNPCLNDGVCEETDEGFECSCVGDWKPPTCSSTDDDDDDDDDDDNDDILLLVILLLVLAFIIIAVTCIAVAICHRRRREEEDQDKSTYENMPSEYSAPAELGNNKAWFATYSNSGNTNSAYNY